MCFEVSFVRECLVAKFAHFIMGPFDMFTQIRLGAQSLETLFTLDGFQDFLNRFDLPHCFLGSLQNKN